MLQPGQHSLAVVAKGDGFVRVSPQINYFADGQTVSVNPIPDLGQDFLGWSGDASGTQNPLSILMDRSKVITANFTTRAGFDLRACSTAPAEDGFRLLMSGKLGIPYAIEASANLTTWIPLITLTNLTGVMQFTDREGSNFSHRFYRGVVTP